MFTTADINFYAARDMMVRRMFPERDVDTRCPRLVDWRERMEARPGVKAALEMPDYTAPGAADVYGALSAEDASGYCKLTPSAFNQKM